MIQTPKSKKGQLIGESVALFSTTVLVAIILVAFYLIIKTFFIPVPIENLKFSNSDSAFVSLNAYLHTPVNISCNGENITLREMDLMKLAQTNQSYILVFQTTTHDILDRVFGDRYSIDLRGPMALMVFPPRASTYSACEKISLPNNLEATLCLK